MKHLRKTYRLSVTDSGSRTTCQESRCQENQKVISNCAAVLEGFLCCARGVDYRYNNKWERNPNRAIVTSNV